MLVIFFPESNFVPPFFEGDAAREAGTRYKCIESPQMGCRTHVAKYNPLSRATNRRAFGVSFQDGVTTLPAEVGCFPERRAVWRAGNFLRVFRLTLQVTGESIWSTITLFDHFETYFNSNWARLALDDKQVLVYRGQRRNFDDTHLGWRVPIDCSGTREEWIFTTRPDTIKYVIVDAKKRRIIKAPATSELLAVAEHAGTNEVRTEGR